MTYRESIRYTKYIPIPCVCSCLNVTILLHHLHWADNLFCSDLQKSCDFWVSLQNIPKAARDKVCFTVYSVCTVHYRSSNRKKTCSRLYLSMQVIKCLCVLTAACECMKNNNQDMCLYVPYASTHHRVYHLCFNYLWILSVYILTSA